MFLIQVSSQFVVVKRMYSLSLSRVAVTAIVSVLVIAGTHVFADQTGISKKQTIFDGENILDWEERSFSGNTVYEVVKDLGPEEDIEVEEVHPEHIFNPCHGVRAENFVNIGEVFIV